MRAVIKVGSSSLFDGEHLIRPTVHRIVGQTDELIRAGHEVAIVTSGAIAVGRRAHFKGVNNSSKPESLPVKQALAALGQPILMSVWQRAFTKVGLSSGQVLATNQELLGREGETLPTLKSTLEGMFAMGIVPVVNENDAIATDQIKVGDNDTLAAHVGNVIGASSVYLLGTTDGIYQDFPAQKKLIKSLPVSELASVRQYCGGTEDFQGTGGALTKIQAAEIFVTDLKRNLFIARASMPSCIERCEAGIVGTRISFN